MSAISDLNVLVVDDEPTFLDIMEVLLRSVGVMQISRAGSGQEAAGIWAMPDCPVTCVLCDVAMAQGNGLELLRAVRTDTEGRFRTNISFVLVTAIENGDVRAMAKTLGASGFLFKPVTAERLLDAIKPNRITNVFQPLRRMLER